MFKKGKVNKTQFALKLVLAKSSLQTILALQKLMEKQLKEGGNIHTGTPLQGCQLIPPQKSENFVEGNPRQKRAPRTARGGRGHAPPEIFF